MAIVIKIKLVPFFIISETVNITLITTEAIVFRLFIVSGINTKRITNDKRVLNKLAQYQDMLEKLIKYIPPNDLNLVDLYQRKM